MTVENLADKFNECFEIILANTPNLIEEVYRIRYKVYCQELKFELEENCPGGMERDMYDEHSVHCLLLHRSSGKYAGCVRLVLPELTKSYEKPYEVFPFGKIRFHSFQQTASYPPETSLNALSAFSMGEVSRLAVTAEFRKQQGETEPPCGVSAEESLTVEEERRHFPLIALGLYLAATSLTLEAGLTNVCTMMEPRLARLLKRSRIHFKQLSEIVAYHGNRALYMINPNDVVRDMNPEVHEVFQVIHFRIKASLNYTTTSLFPPSKQTSQNLKLDA